MSLITCRATASGASAGVTLRSRGSVADNLIALAGREKVDLLVAGGYGHSRLDAYSVA